MKNFNFIREKITTISKFLKLITMGKNIILSLLYVMFVPLLDSKKTPKKKRIKNLSYKALKRFPKFFAVKLLRIFAIKEVKKDYKEWLSRSNSHKSKKKLKVRIDGTKSGKKYAKKMPALKLVYDYVNHCKIKTHTIYIMVVSLGNKDYIVDFRLVKRNKDGWNKIAKRMINVFLRVIGKTKTALRYIRLSLDGAWGNGDMLLFIKKKGFRYNAIKSGGKDIVLYNEKEFSLKKLKNYLSKTETFKKFNFCHNLQGSYCSVIVTLKGKNIPIRVVVIY